MDTLLERVAPLAALLTREMGLDAARKPRAGQAEPLPLAPGRRQWLPVSAHIRERYLVTYRAPAARLAALVPAPLTIDSFNGCGFVSVCALEMDQMGIAGTPSWLRFSNRELLYRIGVRVAGQPTFFTLRSDVSAPALALLGTFSHYRLRRAEVVGTRFGASLRLRCLSRDGQADADFEASPTATAAPATSSFTSVEAATNFLIGMKFSVDVTPAGRVRVQDIDHQPWGARFAQATRRRFDFLERVARAIGATLEYDHTLAMTDLQQTWRAARWL